MFEIDFLRKAKRKQQPHYLAVIGVTVALLVPFVVASDVTIRYFEYKIEVPSLKRSLDNKNTRLQEMLDYEATLNTLGSERTRLMKKLNDVADSVKHYVQWSDAMASLAEGVPDNVFIRNIVLEREPSKILSSQVLRYKYKLNIGAVVIGSPNAMQQFIQFLRFSWPLRSNTRNVEMLVQRRVQIEGGDFPLYLIECTWEP